jgi:hypothetical protein
VIHSGLLSAHRVHYNYGVGKLQIKSETGGVRTIEIDR